ncbi:hypothetical protein UR09_05630 [Candidatus Nitromaritima sp. SCGC AAA799-A02]|nr:hypothetical protein UR09_05630 [Candidatus Nitromaritima sp. SCGC AAA799-A02]KMP11433.1 hypothetical protein UZ36_04490 [Candidatus Nitromaritima sp. SCGC AAA799-C22]
MILSSKNLMREFGKGKIYGLLCLFILFGLGLSEQPVSAEEAVRRMSVPQVDLNESGFSPSNECGKCHKDIYETWENSLHSQSVGNSVFWTSFLQAYYKDTEYAKKVCFRCHSPIALKTGDLKLEEEISREGVNCDFCHSVSGIKRENIRFQYDHEFGNLKQGPLKNVESPVHKTRFNELFRQSKFCAGCHEFETPNGIKLIETYSEWKGSPYPGENTHCQDCHMRKVKGKIVASTIVETKEEKFSSHDIAGGHSLAMREKSLDIIISDVEQVKQKLVVTVEITNKGAGHKIPTGLPSKKIVLRIVVQSKNGKVLKTQERVYQKLLLDKDGAPVTRDSDLMLGKGVRVISDNRLAPLEARKERFMFFLPGGAEKKVSVTAFYSHSPEITQQAPIHIKMNTVSQWTK